MKKIANVFGIILTLLSLYFLIIKYQELKSRVGFNFSDYSSLSILLMSIIYALSATFLALAWGSIIFSLNGKIKLKPCLAIYGVSQIGKYVPGNIFHYVGKQAMGMAYHIPGKLLIKSQFLEIIIQLMSAVAFVTFVFFNLIFKNQFITALVSLVIVMISIVTVLFFYNKKLLSSYIFYTLFLCVSGCIFFYIINVKNDSAYTFFNFIFIVSAFSTAWLLGFVVPGAPAGIGIRETILIALLTPSGLSEGTIFSAAILSRIISVSGDFLFFLIASFLHFLKKDE